MRWGQRHRGQGERGASAVEYGLIVALIAVVLTVSVGLLGGRLQSLFSMEATVASEDAGPGPETAGFSLLSADSWYTLGGSLTTEANGLLKAAGGSIFNNQGWDSANMAVESTASLNGSNGYGVWVRAAIDPGTKKILSGYTFQVDPGLGNKFVLRVWNDGKEYWKPVATTAFPPGFDPSAANRIRVVADGNTLTATVNGTTVMTVDDLETSVVDTTQTFRVPTGSSFGVRTWGSSSAMIGETSVAQP